MAREGFRIGIVNLIFAFLLQSPANAADVEVGGGIDLVAGVVHPPAGAWSSAGGVRALEGDLQVRGGAVTFEAALDASATFAMPLPIVFALVPEQLTLTGDTGPVWISGGVAPAPWRIEAVDGWDNALVTWSAAHRGYLAGSLLAVEVGGGTPERGVSAIAATPAVPPLNAPTANTFFTPGMATALALSKLVTLPPKVGHITTLA